MTSPGQNVDVIVIGAGRYGGRLIEQLLAAGSRVLAVDADPQALTRVERLGAQTLYGDAEEPELVEDFQAAIAESLQYAQDNPDEVRRIITTYTQIAPEVAEQMALPAFPQEINVESMETVAELMQEYGITTEPADVDALLATG